MRARGLAIAAMLLLLRAAVAPAQGAADGGAAVAGATVEPAPRRIALLLSGARGAEVKTRLGHRHDRDLFMVTVRGGWTLARGSGVSLEYTADLVPIVVATGNRAYEQLYCPAIVDGCTTVPPTPERYTAYAAGLAPIGLAMRARLSRRLDASIGGSGGALLFSRAVPDADETRFNWTAEGNAALSIALERRVALVIGYRYHHISNGGRGPVNPGMNTHLVAIGVERVR